MGLKKNVNLRSKMWDIFRFIVKVRYRARVRAKGRMLKRIIR